VSPAPRETRDWPFVDCGEWQFLLPASRFERLLCYDNLGGATMLHCASLARQVLVVHHDPAELERLRVVAEAAGESSLRFALAGADLGPGGPEGFDGALVHDPQARVLRGDRGPGPAADALCSQLATALRPQGFLYLGLRNRFSYQRLRGASGVTPRLLSARTATRAVREAGLATQPPHPLLMDETRISEIVPPAGYRSAKNPFLLAERLRELLLRGWGSRHLAPAYGVSSGFEERQSPAGSSA
jgi:hypothetical protein